MLAQYENKDSLKKTDFKNIATHTIGKISMN